jgi:hypothetical protein
VGSYKLLELSIHKVLATGVSAAMFWPFTDKKWWSDESKRRPDVKFHISVQIHQSIFGGPFIESDSGMNKRRISIYGIVSFKA